MRGADGLLQLPAADAAVLGTFTADAAAAGTQRFALNLAPLAADPAAVQSWQEAAAQAGFTHFQTLLP